MNTQGHQRAYMGALGGVRDVWMRKGGEKDEEISPESKPHNTPVVSSWAA